MQRPLTFIIPCFNEFNRFPLLSYINFIELRGHFGFLFVNDGSTDETMVHLKKLNNLFPDQVIILDLPLNKGKAAAVRTGMNFLIENNISEHLLFIDADLSTPLAEGERIYQILLAQNLQFAFGSRIALFGSKIKRSPTRHYLGRLFATMAQQIIEARIYDTQCGAKVFHYSLASFLFQKPFTTRWLFDIEIFARLEKRYSALQLDNLMMEVPLSEWNENSGSKIKLSDILRIPFVLAKLLLIYRLGRKTTKFYKERQNSSSVATVPFNERPF